MYQTNNNAVEIQIQDVSGRWFTIQTTPNTGEMVKMAMDGAFALYKKRVRALAGGAVLDFRM